jgi:hypothetical protein
MNEREEDTWCRFFFTVVPVLSGKGRLPFFVVVCMLSIHFVECVFSCSPQTLYKDILFAYGASSRRPRPPACCVPISRFGCLMKGLLHAVFLFLVSAASWKASRLSARKGLADSKFPTCKGVGDGNFLACDRVLPPFH